MVNVFKLVKKIQKESETAEEYHSGLVGEKLIVSAYKTMTIEKLEQLRFVLNKIIKKKKEMLRVQQANKEKESQKDEPKI